MEMMGVSIAEDTFCSKDDREVEFIRFDLFEIDEFDGTESLLSTESKRDDDFWSEDHRELELMDEEDEVEAEERVVREEDENRFE